MKRWPLGFLLVLALSAHAENFWDGNAAVQPGDAEFASGLFAVSNAFARDTEIVVQDLATGKTTTARVVGRLDERMDVLVLLSSAAALPLGLEQGEIASVRVTVRQEAPEEPASILAEDRGSGSDPDRLLTTAATVTTTAQATGTEVEETTAAAEQAAAAAEETPGETVLPVAEAVKTGAPAVTEAAAETTKTSETAETAEAPTEEPAAEAAVETAEAAAAEAPAEEAAAEETVASSEDSDFLAGLAARSPQKRLFLPPREDEMFAYQQPVEPPEEVPAETVEVAEQPPEAAAAAAAVEAAAAPEIASDARPAAPVTTTEPIALAEAQPPAEMQPELVETLVATAPEPEPEPVRPLAVPEAVAAQTPAADGAEPVEAPVAAAAVKPPTVEPPAAAVKPPTLEKPAAAEKPAAVLTLLDLPSTGSFTWYLQLAAYSTEALAKETAARLTPTYPVLVLAPPVGSKPLYRVFVGPLNRAESGTLLAYFRHRGFPDAFVRTAQK